MNVLEDAAVTVYCDPTLTVHSLWTGCAPLLLLLTGLVHCTDGSSKELHLDGSVELGWIRTQGGQQSLQIYHKYTNIDINTSGFASGAVKTR